MSKKSTDIPMPKDEQSDELVSQMTADMQRIQADFINFKRRAEEDRKSALAYGRESAIQELLPVFDNLQRAFSHVPADLEGNNWVKGIVGLDKQLVSVMKGFGLEKIDVLGKPFDPTIMEAVSVDDSTGDTTEIVSEELQAGYALNGTVIRPAMVRLVLQ